MIHSTNKSVNEKNIATAVNKHEYRPEIDGLRAIAIVPVVLFHTGLAGFSGGFVGVDVFFVISGFLISRQILGDISKNKFSMIEFWTRRARRIIPAISVVMAFVLIAGWFIFFPINYRDLGRSAAAQSIFSSNIFFWLKAGYFTATSETKPLLHTWSLSVEEQFYLCIPILLWFFGRWHQRKQFAVIVFLLFVSFLTSVWSTFAYPDAAFYLLQNRGWELLLGCAIAMLPEAKREQITVLDFWRNEILGGAGLLLIIYAVTQYTSRTPFPGIAALLPCGGAACIIYANTSQKTIIGRLLSLRLFLWIGLISYSLYLWHWPLLAFARYNSIEPLSTVFTLFIVAISIPIAWLSYRFVETPVRRNQYFRKPLAVLSCSGFILVLVFLSGSYVAWTNGVSWRPEFQVTTFESDVTRASQRSDLCEQVTTTNFDSSLICRLGKVENSKPKVLLVGDSFAGMYLEVFNRLSVRFDREVWYVKDQNTQLNIIIQQMLNTGLISDVVIAYSWRRALQSGIPELKLNAILEDKNKSFWISSLYDKLVTRLGYNPLDAISDTKQPFKSDLAALVNSIIEKNVRVFILDAPPYQAVSVPLKLGLIVKRGGDPMRFGSKLKVHLEEFTFIHGVFKELSVIPNVTIIYPTDVLCDQNGFCRTYQDGHSLYSDDAHLSEYAGRFIEPLLVPVFEAIK